MLDDDGYIIEKKVRKIMMLDCKRTLKKIGSIVLSLAVVLTMLPAVSPPVKAVSGTITGNGEYNISDYGNNSTITIDPGLTVTLLGEEGTTYENLCIACGVGVKLTINNVSIDNSSYSKAYALSFSGSDNILTLAGTNTLESGSARPGIAVITGSSLEISGDGALYAFGGSFSAGIGGYSAAGSYSGGNVTISGGTVSAKGGSCGSGIGGGLWGSSGTVTIIGGTVTATGTSNSSGIGGAGIGGGGSGAGGTVTISGGTVTATGAGGGAGIGGGNGRAGGTVTISGGTVTATGDGGAGIGGSTDAANGSCYISGGSVNASSMGTGAVYR